MILLKHFLLYFFILLVTPAIVMATPANQELSAEIGLDGVVRAGHWTSVTLRMPQSLAEPTTRYVAVESQDPDGQWLRSPLVRPALIDETHWAARLLVKIGSRDSIIRAVVLDTMEPNADASHLAQVVTSKSIQIPQLLESSQEVVMLFGELDNATRATRLATREDGSRMLVVSPAQSSASIPLSHVFGPSGLTFDGIDKADLVKALQAELSAPAKSRPVFNITNIIFCIINILFYIKDNNKITSFFKEKIRFYIKTYKIISGAHGHQGSPVWPQGPGLP